MKQLPEKIVLDKAVHGQRLYQGSLELQQMTRLKDVLADSLGTVEFSIQFERAAGTLGKAQVNIKAELPLICTISAKKFMFPVNIESTLGFIDDLAYEDMLDVNMEASWVDEDFIKPLKIIEDELILVIPDAPYDDSSQGNDETNTVSTTSKEAPNPFDVLKSLK